MFMANNQASKSIVIDYDAIAKQESFKALVRKKNAFLWSITVFFLAAYMLLPILTSYTTILHQKAIGEVTWVWIYAAGLFIMTWSLCHLYVAKANSYDKEIIRRSMSISRKKILNKNKEWIEKYVDLAKENLAQGKDVLKSNILPRIEICNVQNMLYFILG